MRIGGKDFKTVLLLGAGASRGALRHVTLGRRRVKAPLNGDFFDVAKVYVQGRGEHSADYKRYKRLMKTFRRDLPFGRKPTMEEAFSSLFVAKDFPDIYTSGPGRRPQPGHRTEIEDFLRLAFGILTLLDKRASCTLYDEFVMQLTAGDTIITLNYDTLLDSALVRHGWDPSAGYCLGGGNSKVTWKRDASCQSVGLKNVRLLKLHGSVNWYVKGSFSNIRQVFDKKPVRVSQPRSNEMSGHIRQIIPPIYGKFFAHDHWRKLWGRSFRALCDSEAFVVIGCSLIDSDFHLRALISRAVTCRKQDSNLFRRALFVDRVTVRRKWRKALRGSFRARDECTTFERFVDRR